LFSLLVSLPQTISPARKTLRKFLEMHERIIGFGKIFKLCVKALGAGTTADTLCGGMEEYGEARSCA
jgi:hypothetical protein